MEGRSKSGPRQPFGLAVAKITIVGIKDSLFLQSKRQASKTRVNSPRKFALYGTFIPGEALFL